MKVRRNFSDEYKAEVVRRHQPTISDRDHAADGKTRHHAFERALEGRDLGDVPFMHFVVNRNTFSGLHDAEHELAADAAILALAVAT